MTTDKQTKNRKHRPVLLLAALLGLFLGGATGCSDDACDPPAIRIYVNGAEVTAPEPIAVGENAEVEYRFEVQAFSTITDLKTVFFDISLPHRKVATEVLVGGLSESQTETVKGVCVPTSDTEIMLIVKDIDGNESARSFSLVFE